MKDDDKIKNMFIKGTLPASFNQKLMRKIRQEKEETRRPVFAFFAPRLAYALAGVLIILCLAFFFLAPPKHKTDIAVAPQQQIAVVFTDDDHNEAEKIFLVSNGSNEDDALIELFSNNH